MWMRTTLVAYTTGWEAYEYSQPIAELQDLEYTVPNRKNVLSMITVAHSYVVPAEFHHWYHLILDLPAEHQTQMIVSLFLPAMIVIQVFLELFQVWPKAGSMRCDGEPSTLALLEACVKTCRTLGIRVVPEPTAIGSHQSNGGAQYLSLSLTLGELL